MNSTDRYQSRPEAPPASETRTDRQRRRTRKAMLDAGLTLIADQGLNRLTIAGITETADVGLGTFYNHFEDRAEYLRDLFTGNVANWLAEFNNEHDARFPLESDRIAVAAISLVRHARLHPTWGAYVSEILAGPDVTVNDEFSEVLLPCIERGIEQGCFTITDSGLGVRFFLGLARQCLLYAQHHEPIADLEVSLATAVLCSLGAPANTVGAVVSASIARSRDD